LNNLYLGSIGWSYNFWKGSFYPDKMPSNVFLKYYSSKFNSVEVDSTFYRIPNIQTVSNWKEQTPEDFIFSLKFPKFITHIKRLKDCQRETIIFLDKVKVLERKLGPLLLQFAPSFGSEYLPTLTDFIQTLPKRHKFVVEVRNKSLLNKDLYDVLRANKIALAWVDSPLMPQILEITTDFVYVRLEGDRRKVKGVLGKTEIERETDIATWAQKIKPFIDGATPYYVYFGKHFSGYPPLDIERFLKILKTT
jgi:uncharacterized protein YecE (DUF72 family)